MAQHLGVRRLPILATALVLLLNLVLAPACGGGVTSSDGSLSTGGSSTGGLSSASGGIAGTGGSGGSDDRDREGSLNAVASTDAGFVAVGWSAGRPLIVTSEDGASWSSADVPSEHGSLSDVAAGNAIVVAVGGGGVANSQVARRDGDTWQVQLHGQNYGEVLFGNGVFLMNAGVEAAATSSDGASWTRSQIGARLFGFDGTRFLALGTSGEFRSSSDGVSWTEPRPAAVSEIVYGTLAAVGDQILVLGCVMPDCAESRHVMFLGESGDDLSAFTRSDLDWSDAPRAIASDENRVVVACRSSLRTTLLPVGSTEWSKFDLASQGISPADVAYRGGRFVTVGSRGSEVSVLTSSDGVNWSTARVP